MKKIYIVCGSTGEYSDHRTWMVKGFPTKRKAIAYAKECQKLIDKQDFDYWQFKHSNWKHPLDKYFEFDYTGTSYYISDVPFEDPELHTKWKGDK